MKAAYRDQYCPPQELTIKELPLPTPASNEVLVKVKACTVNRTDIAILTGEPAIIKLFTGFPKPKLKVTGTDFAGVVEAVGDQVISFKPGDKVWGFKDNGWGTHAQYITLKANQPVMHMPQTHTFDQAAASAEGAHYAYNFISKVHLHPGMKVMLNGASGAIGSAALQFLKYFQTNVTAICGTKNVDLIQSLGADRVIDYEKEDFTRDEEKYDFVFDAVGKSTFSKCKKLLKPKGVYISSELGAGGQNPLLAIFTSFTGGKKVIFPVPFNIKRSMSFVIELAEKGKFKPLIEKAYPLQEISEAFQYVASGQKTGNVIIHFD